MLTSAHVNEVISSEVLWISVDVMRDLPHFGLGNSPMNQFPAIVPYRIPFWIVMKPSHDNSFQYELRLRAQPYMKKPDIDYHVKFIIVEGHSVFELSSDPFTELIQFFIPGDRVRNYNIERKFQQFVS